MGRPLQEMCEISYAVSYHSHVPLPESVIIDLHALFLTKGIHRISVPTLYDGRNLVVELVRSLDYYQRVGYLTLDIFPTLLDTTLYYDMRSIITRKTISDESESFSELFDYDLFIIEYGNKLSSYDWFKHLIVFLSSSAVPTILMSV